MLKIGEFSKLSLLTIKALRYYEKEGLLYPAAIDEWTGYRYYETSQLETAAKINAYRQIGLTVEEIKSILAGAQAQEILERKAESFRKQQAELGTRLSIIDYLLDKKHMKYQAVIKDVGECVVFYEERRLERCFDRLAFIPESKNEFERLNPDPACVQLPYEFCEYPEAEHRKHGLLMRYNGAVSAFGTENERIRFRKVPAVRVISIYHKGSYENIGEAYAFIMEYAEKNGYERNGLLRECYIDGIRNKKSPEEWLTEIQMPIK